MIPGVPIARPLVYLFLFENVMSWYEHCGIVSILPQTLNAFKFSGHLISLSNIFRRIMEDEYSCQKQCKLVTCWHFILSVESVFRYTSLLIEGKNPDLDIPWAEKSIPTSLFKCWLNNSANLSIISWIVEITKLSVVSNLNNLSMVLGFLWYKNPFWCVHN